MDKFPILKEAQPNLGGAMGEGLVVAEKPKLLIVDDEPSLHSLLSECLNNHYTLHAAENGHDAISIALKWKPDLILMDIRMPGIDGVEACKALRNYRETKHIPILFLTAANSLHERVRSFNMGADDFIAKPFDLDELMARLQSKLRRAKDFKHAPVEVLNAGNIHIDLGSHEVRVNSQLVPLSPVEFGILKLLIENHGQVVSRKEILKFVWQDARKKDRLIDAHVTALRKKIGQFNGEIQTIYGMGYKLIPPAHQ